MALEDGDNELSMIARENLSELYEELGQLTDKVQRLRHEIMDMTKDHECCQRLRDIPGYGVLVAPAFISEVGDGHQFGNGRQCAAWLGLVPRLKGTGGHIRVLSITKNGNRELRAMLIHGARAVVRWAHRRDDPMGRWIQQLQARRGTNIAVVAMANKMARIGWRVVACDEKFDMNKAFG